MGSESQTSIDRLKWDQIRIAFFTNLLLDQGKKKKKEGNNGWKPEACMVIHC